MAETSGWYVKPYDAKERFVHVVSPNGKNVLVMTMEEAADLGAKLIDAGSKPIQQKGASDG